MSGITNSLRKIIVVGHKNPDTDSICSAIAYANLKNQIMPGQNHVARRAGSLNEETQYVLKHFGVESPEYIDDVGTQVSDIEIRDAQGVSRDISLKKAWALMKDANVVTLPITKGDKLEGLITIKDIVTAYMDVYDSRILSLSRTNYKSIVETLAGKMIVGDENAWVEKGKIIIAAGSPDVMEDFIEDHDIVIAGNRYESQLCAIEMNAGCIVVCTGVPVSKTIQKLAKERGCTIISTEYDTYSVARLINQSAPISYFMRTKGLITFFLDDFTEDIKKVMAQKRHRDFPVLDEKGSYCGMISRRFLLNTQKKQMILVDHNEKTQAVDGLEETEILEIIDHHRLGSLETISPVFFRNQPVGCTATIVYQMYRENQVEIPKEIAGLLCAAIISDTLVFKSPTCTKWDEQAAEALSDIADVHMDDFAKEMFHAGSNLGDKSAEEIFYQDFKKFSIQEMNFGVGQINSMDAQELLQIKETIIPYMENACRDKGLDMVFFMLTNILKEETMLLYRGHEAESIIEGGFDVPPVKDVFILKGVVSRKKQLIPAIVEGMQQ